MLDQKTIPNYKKGKNALLSELKELLPAAQLEIFNNDADQLALLHPNPLLLQVGDKAPAFSLPNANNTIVHSSDLLKKGPIVLTFYRGAWCPYCNLYLKQLQAAITAFEAQNVSLVAVSPQKPDHALSQKEKNALTFHVLSDETNEIGRKYVTVFAYSDIAYQAMADLGYDFDSFYADQGRAIPVPATYVITTDGKIIFAQSEGGDYRERVEITDIINTLQATIK